VDGDVDRIAGRAVQLRPAVRDDIPILARIRATPEVYAYWRGGDDLVAAVEEDFAEPGTTAYAIELDGAVIGWIQWQAEEEPDYRHASIDIYLDPVHQGRGLGSDAVRALARHLFTVHGHHRIEIDPAADNHAAIRAYSKVGFRPVGITRRSERGPDGTWHDGLLMDLLAEELTADAPATDPPDDEPRVSSHPACSSWPTTSPR
jgi:aminoglycoside 6'-N-acetyltransferase